MILLFLGKCEQSWVFLIIETLFTFYIMFVLEYYPHKIENGSAKLMNNNRKFRAHV